MDNWDAMDFGKILGQRRAFVEIFSKLNPTTTTETVTEKQVEVQNYCMKKMRELTTEMVQFKEAKGEV